MASTWGDSWGVSWGDSWGPIVSSAVGTITVAGTVGAILSNSYTDPGSGKPGIPFTASGSIGTLGLVGASGDNLFTSAKGWITPFGKATLDYNYYDNFRDGTEDQTTNVGPNWNQPVDNSLGGNWEPGYWRLMKIEDEKLAIQYPANYPYDVIQYGLVEWVPPALLEGKTNRDYFAEVDVYGFSGNNRNDLDNTGLQEFYTYHELAIGVRVNNPLAAEIYVCIYAYEEWPADIKERFAYAQVMVGDNWSPDITGFPDFSAVPMPDGATFRVECVGTTFRVYINNALISEFQVDDAYLNDEVGINLWMYSESEFLDSATGLAVDRETPTLYMDNFKIGNIAPGPSVITAKGTTIGDGANLFYAYGSVNVAGTLSQAYLHEVSCITPTATMRWFGDTMSAGFTDPNLFLPSATVTFSGSLDVSSIYARGLSTAMIGQLSVYGRKLPIGTGSWESGIADFSIRGFAGPGTIDGKKKAIINTSYGSIEVYNNSLGGFYTIGESGDLKEAFGLINVFNQMNAIGEKDAIKFATGTITV